ncbi:MAG: polysaccharide biosynthesis/export family protein [Pseudomonadota bacterium]
MSPSTLIKSAAAASCLALLAACQSGIAASDAEDIAQSRKQVVYTLGSGDQLRVTVFGQEDISGEYEVDGSGNITVPLIGEVAALGETTTALSGAIETKLAAGYLRDPNVSVEVMNYRPFYILGEVGDPGEYDYTAGLSVLNAIASAGGFTYRANRKTVFITAIDDTEEVAIRLNTALQVQPGDTIRIGERLF